MVTAVLGTISQLLIQLPEAKKTGYRYRFVLDLKDDYVKIELCQQIKFFNPWGFYLGNYHCYFPFVVSGVKQGQPFRVEKHYGLRGESDFVDHDPCHGGVGWDLSSGFVGSGVLFITGYQNTNV